MLSFEEVDKILETNFVSSQYVLFYEKVSFLLFNIVSERFENDRVRFELDL